MHKSGNVLDKLMITIAVKNAGKLTLPIVRELVSEIVLVDEESIERAVNAYLTLQKTMAEGAGAATRKQLTIASAISSLPSIAARLPKSAPQLIDAGRAIVGSVFAANGFRGQGLEEQLVEEFASYERMPENIITRPRRPRRPARPRRSCQRPGRALR